jgi:murein DD-endopeptidase MepM/ murein hydrolase activator NlpD
MALENPVPSSRLSQRFGPSSLGVEPAMYATVEKCFWANPGPFPGSKYYAHFHPALDRAAASGTPIYAGAAGKVSVAGWWDDTSGYKVEIWINGTTAFGHNHMKSVAVRVGQVVKRGQILGTVGATGVTTGAHTHYYVSVRERASDGVERTMLYDPLLFEKGGKYANDPRAQSIYEPAEDEELVDVDKTLPPMRCTVPINIKLFTEPRFDAPYNAMPADVVTNAPYEVTGASYRVGSGTSDRWLEVGYKNQRRYVPKINVKLEECGLAGPPTDCATEVLKAKEELQAAWLAYDDKRNHKSERPKL